MIYFQGKHTPKSILPQFETHTIQQKHARTVNHTDQFLSADGQTHNIGA